MATQEQITANQANAKLSCGPVSDAGKAVSSRNAISHACCANSAVILEGEQGAFEKMRAGLKNDIKPYGQLQLELFDTLVLANWNQRRCRLTEIKLMAECEKGVDPLLDPEVAKRLDRISLYARRHDATFHRALRALRQLQTEAAFRLAVLPIGKGVDDRLGIADSIKVRTRLEAEMAKIAKAEALEREAGLRQILDRDASKINQMALAYWNKNQDKIFGKNEPNPTKINGTK